MLLIFLLHLYNNNVNDLCKRAGARHPGPPFSDFRETIHRVAHAGDHHVTSLLLLSCHTGVLLSTKLRKVTKVTDSVRRNLSPIFLSSWGDFKSKAKVKTNFPENFGAFNPSENAPLGEKLLNVTMHFSCLHLFVICDVVAHNWIHWIKLALRHFGKFWDPFSQRRCKISILPKGC